eukprot:10765076-Alexandrium_andersonii.AAC.1
MGGMSGGAREQPEAKSRTRREPPRMRHDAWHSVPQGFTSNPCRGERQGMPPSYACVLQKMRPGPKPHSKPGASSSTLPGRMPISSELRPSVSAGSRGDRVRLWK